MSAGHEALELQELPRGIHTMEHDRLLDETRRGSHRYQNLNNNQGERVNRRTVLKLDLILLPFLSLLFLFNSLDKSNIGSAETGHFTKDAGLPPSALNVSVACFFAVFVALQPVGAAVGRKFGMAIYVPTCMALWGLCTALHVAVRQEWQLITLRILVGILESGFYPTAVAYLSLFYTRFEFAKRLGLFYGQSAVAGALGGLLSWAVFSHFPEPSPTPDRPEVPPPSLHARADNTGWKSWQILFMIEGSATVVLALVGFFWLPHSAERAWFFTKAEQEWAEQRIRRDRDLHAAPRLRSRPEVVVSEIAEGHGEHDNVRPLSCAHGNDDEEASGLLSSFKAHTSERGRRNSTMSAISITADTGLSRTDITSALTDWKIWYLLVCNILSAIPATAFSVFLPLVVRGLASDPNSDDLAPAKANLLTVPPFLAGASILWIFTAWSDRRRERLIPILWGLAILLIGLTGTIILPATAYVLRYVFLTILLSGSFIASPLTVAWLTNNIPEAGKRAIVLGINGWGNLAGVFAAILFSPRYEQDGYMIPFYITLACVLVAFVGFMAFRALLVMTNRKRDALTKDWGQEEDDREAVLGDVGLNGREGWWAQVVHSGRARAGDEKLTYRYGL